MVKKGERSRGSQEKSGRDGKEKGPGIGRGWRGKEREKVKGREGMRWMGKWWDMWRGEKGGRE